MSIVKQFIIFVLACMLAACMSVKNDAGKSGAQHAAVDESNTEKGIRYRLGRGVPQDNKRAFYYFNQAAKHGDPYASNEVAYLYAVGQGTKQNYQKALSFYQYAADYGLASAQYNLALMYQHGLGTTKNIKLAKEWLAKAAAQNFEPAKQSSLTG